MHRCIRSKFRVFVCIFLFRIFENTVSEEIYISLHLKKKLSNWLTSKSVFAVLSAYGEFYQFSFSTKKSRRIIKMGVGDASVPPLSLT